MTTYLESSAMLKLIRREPESEALATWLRRSAEDIASSPLTETECRRAAQRLGLDQEAVTTAMDAVALVRPDDSVFTMAGLLTGRHLRSLDALHITLALRAGCSTMVTYDDRQAVAARQAGLAVVAPA